MIGDTADPTAQARSKGYRTDAPADYDDRLAGANLPPGYELLPHRVLVFHHATVPYTWDPTNLDLGRWFGKQGVDSRFLTEVRYCDGCEEHLNPPIAGPEEMRNLLLLGEVDAKHYGRTPYEKASASAPASG